MDVGELHELREQVKLLKEQLEGKGHRCVVCLASERSHAFVPCGHRCVCHLCGVSVVHSERQCPICRKMAPRRGCES